MVWLFWILFVLQIERMLSLWRQKQDEQATLAVLLEALRSSGMEDIAQNLEINNA